ncbi:hypothetical protein VTK56DRAFT_10049 [Thermocarpiscus australiensis]
MADLSVGYAAGLIALGIVIAQVWLPSILAFLLAGVLRDDETAASWTVAAKILQSSHWPTVLRADSARSHAVRTPILLTSFAVPFATILTAVAGIVTPLGLYDEIETGKREVGNFSYVRDTSAYFDGTSPRGLYPFSRKCALGLGVQPCPYTNDTIIFSANSTTMNWQSPNGLTTDIPPILRDIYSSGTRGIGTTVSNFFDIEWRQLTMGTDDEMYNNGSAYAVNMFRQLDSIVLGDSVRLLEGLVVDTLSGGIGFRNHTLPMPPARNVSWQEDLLFIEPTTACVDTNLTIDYTESEWNFTSSSSGPPDYRLTDRGGFVNLNHTYPYYDRSNPQANPDLWGRAYKAAMIHNFYAMVYFNVTNPANSITGAKAFQYLNSTLGKSFPLAVDSLVNYRAASFTSRYGSYLFSTDSVGDEPRYPNPFNVTLSGWFDGARVVCSGAGPDDYANVSNIYVGCGLVKAAPRRVDGGPQGIFERGSKWSAPLYSCATAVRATIKTVQFATTGTSEEPTSLSSLKVVNITDKQYSDPGSYPWWGVEESGMKMRDVQPIWGLVSPAYEKFPNISIVKQPSLYLVGSSDDVSASKLDPDPSYSGYQNLPGAEFPIAVANTIYSGTFGITDDTWPFDLVGRSNMAVFTRWQNLSSSTTGAAKIINLAWTDLAASAVVGTKGVLGPGNAGSATDAATVHIKPSVRRTKYHYLYGIPAFVLLMFIIVFSGLALCAWLSKMSSVAKVRLRIQQLSAGRIFTIVLYPDASNFTMSPKQWSSLSGAKPVSLITTAAAETEDTQPGVVATEEEDTKDTNLNYEAPTQLWGHNYVPLDSFGVRQ